jgi:hypothetical protein
MAAPTVLSNDDKVIPNPVITWEGTIHEWEVLGAAIASIALGTYLRLAGQSTDRSCWVQAMNETKRSMTDILSAIEPLD